MRQASTFRTMLAAGKPSANPKHCLLGKSFNLLLLSHKTLGCGKVLECSWRMETCAGRWVWVGVTVLIGYASLFNVGIVLAHEYLARQAHHLASMSCQSWHVL